MGRYRAPQKPGSPYTTEAGARKARAEMDELWHKVRPEVTRALRAAAAEGDRSENAEYIYRKKQLGEIDRRIRYLSHRLQQYVIVREPPADQDAAYFGAFVTIQHEGREAVELRIVGVDETDAKRHWISVDSPMARALLGKRAGEEVDVELPEGPTRTRLLSIRYK